MDLYFIEDLGGDIALLEDEQFRHAVKVMRKTTGDQLLLTDGRGTRAIGRLESIDKRSARIALTERIMEEPASYGIDIALALTKNIKRIEWAVEKMTEMGVRSISPIVCRHSERDKMNMDRMSKILVAAIKQSQQSWLPELGKPVGFESFCQEKITGYSGTKYIAHLSEDSVGLRHNYMPGDDVLISVGPEGDFSAEELALAKAAGCHEVELGKTRLRTETAAVAAVAYIHALND